MIQVPKSRTRRHLGGLGLFGDLGDTSLAAQYGAALQTTQAILDLMNSIAAEGFTGTAKYGQLSADYGPWQQYTVALARAMSGAGVAVPNRPPAPRFTPLYTTSGMYSPGSAPSPAVAPTPLVSPAAVSALNSNPNMAPAPATFAPVGMWVSSDPIAPSPNYTAIQPQTGLPITYGGPVAPAAVAQSSSPNVTATSTPSSSSSKTALLLAAAAAAAFFMFSQ